MFKYFIQRLQRRLRKPAKAASPLRREPPDQDLSGSVTHVAGREKSPGQDSQKRQPESCGTRPLLSERKRGANDWCVDQFEVPRVEDRTRFHDLGLPVNIMHAIADLGFRYCTAIQAEILPKTLSGRDAMGKAQTGTGKSAAFLINIYTRLLNMPVRGKRRTGLPRALVLVPTRELALQIEKDARAVGKYTNIRIQPIFGGLGYDKQSQALRGKVIDIVVATPGRLLDFLRQGIVRFHGLEILVIDEADRMLDMGFIPDVRRIVRSASSKQRRQTMLFGATLTPEVESLAKQWTQDHVLVDIERDKVAADSVTQMVYIVTSNEKFALLLNLIVAQGLDRVLVFVNRRDQTRYLAGRLRRYRINCSI
ncbi:MAG: DEAD/DEAH box helicase, partial [Thermodesulfobacteriota bacterium]|nr:DEAD/DEAH box helicase [Thermodesulfobacteriota bacterium]